jgi:two-component system, OmpR family, response regulator RegX3
MRVALLEDDMLQAEMVGRWLEDAGHECVHFPTGAEFRLGVKRQTFGLVMLDWMLPDDDGIKILEWLRKTVSLRLPVMMVTARDEESAVVQALDSGANDFLAKPVRREELLARMRALVRRSEIAGNEENTGKLVCGPIELDRDNRRASVNGKAVALSDREFDLAQCIFENPGQLLTRRYLWERFWDTETRSDSRTVDTHMSRLRAKLGIAPEGGFDLRNVYGKGYRLEVLKGPALTKRKII